MMSFWREMRRRHVFRIAGIYVAVGWVLIEILANVLPMFEAPEWIGKTMTLLLVLFFPIALIIAWAFEITPDGIKRADELEDQGEPLPATLPDYLIVAALLIVIGLFFLDFGDRRTSNSLPAAQSELVDEASLAVLPFIDFSEGGENQYLGNGIAEAVLNGLTRNGGLQVASRTSSFAAQYRDMDATEIGTALGVRQILEGSIRRQDARLRVSAQLTDVETGFQIWSDSYDSEFQDIFDIEENLARSLVVALRGPLALDESPIIISDTKNVDAYNLNLRGRYAFQDPSQQNFGAAMAAFQQALSLDPNYWSAHGYLAFCLGYMGIYSDFATTVAATAESAELALRNDPGNIPATLIKGVIEKGLDSAYEDYARVLDQERDRDLTLYVYHSTYLIPQLRQSELTEQLLAQLGEDPDNLLMRFALAMNESRNGNYAEALAYVQDTGLDDGSNFLVSAVLSDVYYRQRDGQRLREVAEQSIARVGEQNGFQTQYLLQAHVINGDLQQAETLLDYMQEKRRNSETWSATTVGLSLASMGRIDDAVDMLVQANRERDFWLRWHLKSFIQDMPALGDHPRMQRLLASMALDDDTIANRIAVGR
ncbi:tetratricopeptide repeat protein [Parahalioglobus pacificus]|uniref:Tetratricopeptide repeat protein n=1 Tax=Parahalioglobus pacificus TaxID=930806 RepID=A0A918XDK3_9GAMM|nr:tetratricopeptide repeat protein [Halioglobus pacificus]GHD27085.1 hypothetical protein GCM10007053_04930 [Halioglobus pacificus]